MGNTVQKLGCFDFKGEECSSFICKICFEPMSPDQRFKNKRCSHPLCVDCISKYIDAKILENSSNVKCPDLKCNKLLDPLSCRPILGPASFERWCHSLCESMTQSSKHAYCPFNECSALVLNECGGTITKAKCPCCKRFFCFQCKVPWHSGYRCSETGDLREMNDIIFGRLMEMKGWQRCPSCGRCVERTSGCPDITCRCRIRFCYKCGVRSTAFHTCKARAQSGITSLGLVGSFPM
ncbi:E3 ubiquitin-protein ligase RSL1-like [Tasmannia lanceolata]|uniref:E3 ubiquitin-protein ligase RSL1-like n=1 Tax=Tasmannia lanceolata TaxID=3420 RepID=UPI004064C494